MKFRLLCNPLRATTVIGGTGLEGGAHAYSGTIWDCDPEYCDWPFRLHKRAHNVHRHTVAGFPRDSRRTHQRIASALDRLFQTFGGEGDSKVRCDRF
jgi:hypothetical protein